MRNTCGSAAGSIESAPRVLSLGALKQEEEAGIAWSAVAVGCLLDAPRCQNG